MLAMRSSLAGRCAVMPPKPFVAISTTSRKSLTIQNAQKKGGGSTKNGRDSEAQRLGVKVYGGQPVKAGGIIMRQRGAKWYPGENCLFGKDFTVFSKVPGIVVYERKPDRNKIAVYSADHPKAKALIEATYTIRLEEGVPNRRARKLACYRPRAEVRAEAAAKAAALVAAP